MQEKRHIFDSKKKREAGAEGVGSRLRADSRG